MKLILLSADAAQASSTEGHNPLIPEVVEIILALVVFGLLYFAFKRFVSPNFERTFTARTEAIEGGLASAEAKQAEADARLAELERRLGEARQEAAQIREEAREQGTTIITEMRGQAQAEASRIVEHGKAQIEAERQQAVTALRTEVGSLATALAGRIVGEALDDDERSNRVVDRFLAELEQLQPEGAPAAGMSGEPTGAVAGADGSGSSSGATAASALGPQSSSQGPGQGPGQGS